MQATQVIADGRYQMENSFTIGTEAVPPLNHHWNYQRDEFAHVGKMTCCLLQSFHKISHKQVNYQKLREQTQKVDENLAAFLSHHIESLQIYTDVDPAPPSGQVLINSHFFSQSVPDIQNKLKKYNLNPWSPQQHLLDVIFHVCNNRHQLSHRKKLEKLKLQVKQDLSFMANYLQGHFGLRETCRRKKWPETPTRPKPLQDPASNVTSMKPEAAQIQRHH